MAASYEQSLVELLGPNALADAMKVVEVVELATEKLIGYQKVAASMTSAPVGASLQSAVQNAEKLSTVQSDSAKTMKVYGDSVELVNQIMAKHNGHSKEFFQNLILAEKAEKEASAARIKRYQEDAAAQKAQMRATKDTEDAYKSLNKQYREAAANAKAIGASLGTTSPQFKIASAAAKEMSDKLKEIDGAVGQNQRNVGNYSGALNKLWSVIRQAAYILPGIGISGILDIGQQAIVGLFDYVRGLTTMNAALTKAKETLNAFNKGLESNEYKSAVTNIAELRAEVQLAKEGFLDKDKVVKHYNDTVGETIGQVKTLNEVDRKLIDQADNYIKMTLYKAAANIALQEAAQKAIEAEKIRLKNLDDFRNSIVDSRVSAGGSAVFGGGTFNAAEYDRETQRIRAAQAKRQADLIKQQADAQKMQENIADSFLQKAAEISKKNQFDFFGGKEDEKNKRQQDLTNERIKAESELTAALFDQQKQRNQIAAEAQKAIADDETNNLQKRVDAYNDYTASLINMAGLESAKEQSIIQLKLEKIAEIEKKSVDKRTNEEKVLLLSKDALGVQLVNATEKYEVERSKIIEDAAKWQTGIIKQYGSEAEQALKKSAENLKGLSEFFAGTGQKQSRQQYLRVLDQRRQAEKDYVDAAISSQQIISDLYSAANEKRLKELDAEISKIQERAQAEIDAVQYSASYATLSEQEKNNKILAIKADADQKEKQIEREKIERQRRQAIFEKYVTIATIIAQTALAVVGALAEVSKGTPYYLAVANAIAAGVAGAAQVARAAATPIPSYKKGIKGAGHPGGLAEVGDGGVTEVAVTPDGNSYLTPSTSTIVDLPKGTRIFPSVEDYIAEAQYRSMRGLGGVLKPVKETPAVSTKEMERYLRRIAYGIDALQTKQPIVINQGFAAYYQHMVK
jgi:hypothetical protein